MTGDDRPAVYEATEEFIEEHGESPIDALLAVDAENETWEFDDISLGSGTFGEVVSRGIVEKVDGKYQVADRESVSAALAGEQPDPSSETTDGTRDFSVPSPDFSSWFSMRTGLLLFGLGFIAFMRSVFHYDDVFRDGAIVLPANDPYRRRYWLETLVESELQPWHPGDLASLPEFITSTDTLFYWLAWTAAAILGNSSSSVSVVLVLYSVVMAMLTGLAVYALALRLTGDARIGIAAVFMLAVIPIHATYTALGFGDHHALDYLLLTFIAGVLVLVVDDRPDVRLAGKGFSAQWTGAIGLGVALAAMNVAWEGTPLWFAGIGVYVLVQVGLDYHRGRAVRSKGVPILAGLTLAAVLTLSVRVGFGWLQSYRVVTPFLLLAGAGTLVATGELGQRTSLSSRIAFPVTVVAGAVVTVGAWFVVPPFPRYTAEFHSYLQRTAAEGIHETLPLFTFELGVIGGPLSYLSGAFVLGVPPLLWLTWVALRDDRPEWLVVTTFAWYLLGWAAVQVRFAGEFAPFLALFAGVGFVWLLSWMDLIADPTVVRETSTTQMSRDSDVTDVSSTTGEWNSSVAVYVVGFFLFVSVLSFIYIPSFMSDITVDDQTYETASWIENYSTHQGYDPTESYVFSPWSQNRHYNYFVSGDSNSYRFAQDNYGDFIASNDPDEWYEQLRSQGRFLVTHDFEVDANSSLAQATLHERFGSAGAGVDGVGHYRALYATDERERVVFELVPGARLTGVGESDQTMTIVTDVDIEGASFTYQREVQTNRYGDYGVTVPYPGIYDVAGDERIVAEADVDSGAFVGPYRSHWTLDEGSGGEISDPVGDHTATVEAAEWVDGVEGGALRFDGTGATIIEGDSAQGIADNSFTISFWVKGNFTAGDHTADEATFPTVLYREGGGGYGFWARSESDDFGLRVDDTDGNEFRVFDIETTAFPEWTLITAVVDRDHEEIRLYENDSRAAVVDATELGDVDDSGRLALGGRMEDQYAPVAIDNVRFYSTDLDEDRIAELYQRGSRP